jgi:hypothetical protein
MTYTNEEISALILELVESVETLMFHADATPIDVPGEETHDEFIARAKAIATQLSG